MNDADDDKRIFLSQTLRGTIRLCAYRVKESTQAGQRDRDLQSHQPVASGSCPFSPTTNCGHCHGIGHRLAQTAFKIKHLTDSHKLSTATGRVEMFNALSGDWPAPCGVGAFQHLPSGGVAKSIDAGFRHRVENADICMTQRIADVPERRDREEHERKRPRFAPEQPNGSAQDHNVKGHPPNCQVQRESQGGASSSGTPTEEDVVIGDDMGIPHRYGRRHGFRGQKEEGRRRGFGSTEGHKTEAGVRIPLGGVRQCSMSVRSSVDLEYAQLQKICLHEQGFR